MSSILQRDSDLIFPANIVVGASAGSGKTFTLTQRYVQFLLSPSIQHNKTRNILAITFTNLAAKEMRQKVLNYLKALCLGNPKEVEEMSGMEYRQYGKEGPLVSRLGFGVMRLPPRRKGQWGTVHFTKSLAIMRQAMEGGVNFFDSHHGYHGAGIDIA